MAGHIASAKCDDWNTPSDLLFYVRKVLGEIHLDPCSNATSIVGAAIAHFGEANGDVDGLTVDWAGRVFVNPPFSQSRRWIRKCRNEALDHKAEIILLCKANVETKGWHEDIFTTADAICFLKGRVTFLVDGVAAKSCAPMPIAMVYWGPRPALFEKVFSKLGVVFRPGQRRAA